MEIPTYWAEASLRVDLPARRRRTLRRFGWSSASQQAAQAHAESRVREAAARVTAGSQNEPRRERTAPYGGPDGLPIREEIIARDPATGSVITRNVYGALCLNTESVLFADIDHERPLPPGPAVLLGCVVPLLALVAGWHLGAQVTDWFGLDAGKGTLARGAAALLSFVFVLRLAVVAMRVFQKWSSSPGRARKRLVAWCQEHPGWNLALYRTPAGLRVLALHDVFNARSPEVAALFAAVKADPIYIKMCTLQACFRARVSPKPWRVGLKRHFPPGGTWPVSDPGKLARRAEWVREYEATSASYASCELLALLGSGKVHPIAAQVRAVHDRLCQVGSGKPLG